MDIHDKIEPAAELELTHGAVLEGVRKEPMIIIGVLLALLIGSIVINYRAWSKDGQAAIAQQVDVALYGPPPPVEPLELQTVAMEIAKVQNAAVPFTSEAVPSAPPFAFRGGPLDMARAMDCLAATIFYEAGNETLQGQMAVVQVVLNRVRHPAYPKTVCGVVFQGQERTTGCQFSYTCDGSMRRLPTQEAWMRYRGIAQAMLGGQVYAPVGMATHYHTDWVLPKWSAKLDKIRAEGTHLFFRWHGFWGTPKAFRGLHAGSEPAFVKMAGLSAAHASAAVQIPANPVIPGIGVSNMTAYDGNMVTGPTNMTFGLSPDYGTPGMSPSPLPGTGSGPAKGKVAVANDAGQFILTVSPGADPIAVAELAQQTCGSRDYCKVMIWTDPSSAPKGFPVSEAQLGSLAFSYLRNRDQGFEKSLWNCGVFPRGDYRQCMRGKPGAAKPAVMAEPAQTKPPRSKEVAPAPSASNSTAPANATQP